MLVTYGALKHRCLLYFGGIVSRQILDHFQFYFSFSRQTTHVLRFILRLLESTIRIVPRLGLHVKQEGVRNTSFKTCFHQFFKEVAI